MQAVKDITQSMTLLAWRVSIVEAILATKLSENFCTATESHLSWKFCLLVVEVQSKIIALKRQLNWWLNRQRVYCIHLCANRVLQ